MEGLVLSKVLGVHGRCWNVSPMNEVELLPCAQVQKGILGKQTCICSSRHRLFENDVESKKYSNVFWHPGKIQQGKNVYMDQNGSWQTVDRSLVSGTISGVRKHLGSTTLSILLLKVGKNGWMWPKELWRKINLITAWVVRL